MKSFIKLLALCALLALPSRAEAKVKIRVATQAPKGTVWMKAMADIARSVKKKTKGGVDIKLYPNGTMGDEKVVKDRIKTGEVDGGLFTGTGLGLIMPKVRILELPFIYRNGTEEHNQVRELLEAEMIEGFERAGFVFMGWCEVGWGYLFSKVECPNLAALQARKCWVWQDDPMAKAAYGVFGLKGVPLALTDVLQQLDTNGIDTVYNSPYGLIGLQWHPKVKFMSRITVGHGTGALLLTKKIFKKIPKKYRKQVLKISRSRCRKLITEIEEENLSSEKELERQGMKILPIPKDELPEYERLGLKLANQMVGKLYPQELLDKVLSYLSEQRKSGGQ
jgi:TRAP-type transport system periplasmic protein